MEIRNLLVKEAFQNVIDSVALLRSRRAHVRLSTLRAARLEPLALNNILKRFGVITMLICLPAAATAQEYSSFEARALVGEVTDESPIVQAVVANNAAELEKLITEDTDLSQKTKDGKYLVLLAAAFGDADLMEVLTANDAPINVRDEDGRNPIHYLALRGEIPMAKLLLIMEPTLALEADNLSMTPLFYAYRAGEIKMADFLIHQAGAQVNRMSEKAEPLAFIFARTLDAPEAIKHMIENELNVFYRNSQDQNLVDVARLAGHEKTAAVVEKAIERMLLQYQKRQEKNSGDAKH